MGVFKEENICVCCKLEAITKEIKEIQCQCGCEGNRGLGCGGGRGGGARGGGHIRGRRKGGRVNDRRNQMKEYVYQLLLEVN